MPVLIVILLALAMAAVTILHSRPKTRDERLRAVAHNLPHACPVEVIHQHDGVQVKACVETASIARESVSATVAEHAAKFCRSLGAEDIRNLTVQVTAMVNATFEKMPQLDPRPMAVYGASVSCEDLIAKSRAAPTSPAAELVKQLWKVDFDGLDQFHVYRVAPQK